MLPRNAGIKQSITDRFEATQWFNENIAATNFINSLGSYGAAAVMDGRTLLEGTHHQKVLVVKRGSQLSGFGGGIDLNPDRLYATGRGSGPPSTTFIAASEGQLRGVSCVSSVRDGLIFSSILIVMISDSTPTKS
jgi:hypothetical protein